MTDDAFHLTALDARRYDFGNALRGYDRSRVDQFRDQVAEELERLSRVNQELEVKARNFHEQLRAFRERDKALNDALISAQQLRGEIREQAQREAQLIIREAQGDAERSVEALRGEIRRAEDELQQLWRNRRSYVQQLRQLMERHMHDLDSAEMVPPPSGLNNGEPAREPMRDPAKAPTVTARAAVQPASSVPMPSEAPARMVTPVPPPLMQPVPHPLPAISTHAAPAPPIIDTGIAPVAPSVQVAPPSQPRPSLPTPSWLDVVDGE